MSYPIQTGQKFDRGGGASPVASANNVLPPATAKAASAAGPKFQRDGGSPSGSSIHNASLPLAAGHRFSRDGK
jgi:hypothetical protein